MISKRQRLSVFLVLWLLIALAACSGIRSSNVLPAASITPAGETLGTTSPSETLTGEVPSNEELSGDGSSYDELSIDEGELILYRGSNPYRNTPNFEVYYSPSAWEYVEDDETGRFHQLYHRDIDDCVLWLSSGGIGALYVGTVNLGDIEWWVFQVSEQVLNYSVQWQDIAFIFGLTIPEPYSTDEGSPCKRAAEEVIATFDIISDPLPNSVKGYELYSWYKEPGGEWHFTLISGTNRLKTYQEVTSPSFAESGWVNITVQGKQSLKFMLDRIPDDVTVSWIGPEWLKEAQADKLLVETISIPEKVVIDEIVAYCQQLNVKLIIEEIR